MILARCSHWIHVCLCNPTWITLYSSIYKLAERTRCSARPKRLSQTKVCSLLSLPWWQMHNSCACLCLRNECPKSVEAYCLAMPVLSAAIANSANGFGKTCASLIISERWRQLEGAWSLWITNGDSWRPNSRLSHMVASLCYSERWWDLQADEWQEGAAQRSTFNNIRKRDLWRAMLRKKYLGKEWKIGISISHWCCLVQQWLIGECLERCVWFAFHFPHQSD